MGAKTMSENKFFTPYDNIFTLDLLAKNLYSF
jgi:hypothetical protein